MARPRFESRTARPRAAPARGGNPFVALLLGIGFLLRSSIATALSVGFVAFAALLWFGFTMPDAPEDAGATTDAIVVLTGGESRIEAAYVLLKDGRAKRMLVTGVDQKVTKPDLLKRLGDPPDELAKRIELEFRAENTIGNAKRTAEWFNSQNMQSMRLVTANYHMRRSLLLFRREMPHARIIAHPVVPKRLRADEWFAHRDGAEVVAREFAKYVAAFFHIPLG
jgi:uncharacterized SAM-binding protein YcdF (DUF218 family)